MKTQSMEMTGIHLSRLLLLSGQCGIGLIHDPQWRESLNIPPDLHPLESL